MISLSLFASLCPAHAITLTKKMFIPLPLSAAGDGSQKAFVSCNSETNRLPVCKSRLDGISIQQCYCSGNPFEIALGQHAAHKRTLAVLKHCASCKCCVSPAGLRWDAKALLDLQSMCLCCLLFRLLPGVQALQQLSCLFCKPATALLLQCWS